MILNQSQLKSERTNVRLKTTYPEKGLATKNMGEEMKMECRWIIIPRMAFIKLAEEAKEVAKEEGAQPKKPIVTVWTWVMRLLVPPAGNHRKCNLTVLTVSWCYMEVYVSSQVLQIQVFLNNTTCPIPWPPPDEKDQVASLENQ
jgi:hypothetical protein